MIVAKGKMVGTLYLLNSIFDFSMDLDSTNEDVTLWHYILGHMSKKGIQILHSINLLPNLKHVDLGFCEHYIYET